MPAMYISCSISSLGTIDTDCLPSPRIVLAVGGNFVVLARIASCVSLKSGNRSCLTRIDRSPLFLRFDPCNSQNSPSLF